MCAGIDVGNGAVVAVVAVFGNETVPRISIVMAVILPIVSSEYHSSPKRKKTELRSSANGHHAWNDSRSTNAFRRCLHTTCSSFHTETLHTYLWTNFSSSGSRLSGSSTEYSSYDQLVSPVIPKPANREDIVYRIRKSMQKIWGRT